MTVETETLKTILKSQYHAALQMLRQSIESCPDDVWANSSHRNQFWQLAYHTLFFTHLYLQPNDSTFRPWAEHQFGVQHEDGIAGPADPESKLPLIPKPYSKRQVMDYWNFCDHMVDGAIDSLNLSDAASGFGWYNCSKLEHQFISLRHIQHHTAQLADRLRAVADVGIKWVGPH